MQKAISGLLFFLLVAWWSAAVGAFDPPEYVLVLRDCYIGGIISTPGIVSHVEEKEPPEEICGDGYTLRVWQYLTETYSSLDEVLARLNSPGTLWGKDQVVGLWHIGKRVGLKLEVTERVEPVRIEERKWTEQKWEVEGEE